MDYLPSPPSNWVPASPTIHRLLQMTRGLGQAPAERYLDVLREGALQGWVQCLSGMGRAEPNASGGPERRFTRESCSHARSKRALQIGAGPVRGLTRGRARQPPSADRPGSDGYLASLKRAGLIARVATGREWPWWPG